MHKSGMERASLRLRLCSAWRSMRAMNDTIETIMANAVQDSLDELRKRISNVRLAPYVTGQKHEAIEFTWNGKPYFGELRGRNRDLCVSGKDTEADKAIAVRCILDGDVWPA